MLWQAALTQPDVEEYIAGCRCSELVGEIGADIDTVVEKLRQIHRVAHVSVRAMLKDAKLTQQAFSVRFCVPKRTVENWAAGVNQCPDYLRLLFAMQLGLISK